MRKGRRRQRGPAATGHVTNEAARNGPSYGLTLFLTLFLRYFEDRSLREVGQERGIEDATRMRVNRALEKLRTACAAQGVIVTSVLLASVLAASTTSAIPAGRHIGVWQRSANAGPASASVKPCPMTFEDTGGLDPRMFVTPPLTVIFGGDKVPFR
jgi:hypothetical protein